MKSKENGEPTKEFAFTSQDFERVRSLIYERAGIALASSKREMVYSRLARRLRANGITQFSGYLDALESGNSEEEWQAFVNALTTNLTSFFRESHHFPLLAEHLKLLQQQPITIWCSASSTGEEPYSIAMTACETFNSMTPPVQIIATDIDTNVLNTASAGVYPEDRVAKLQENRLRKFFLKGRGDQRGLVKVRPELRKLVTFQKLNLLEENWPIKGSFDAIFCRNVMIYFDKETQRKILSRFAPLMKHDALLFAGHSENFSYVSSCFVLRGKTVYELSKSAGTPANRGRTA